MACLEKTGLSQKLFGVPQTAQTMTQNGSQSITIPFLHIQRDENWVSEKLERTEADNQHYSNPDNDPKGPWFPGNLSSPNPRENLRYKIDHPDGRKLEPPPNGWRWSEPVMKGKIATGEVEFVAAERGILRKDLSCRSRRFVTIDTLGRS